MLQLLWFFIEKREDTTSQRDALQAARKACHLLNTASPITFCGKLTILEKGTAMDKALLHQMLAKENAPFLSNAFYNTCNNSNSFCNNSNSFRDSVGSSLPHILYLADSRAVMQTLKSLDLPVACYRHSANRNEDFSGASYVIEQPEEVEDEDWERIYRRLAGYPWTILHTDRCTVREFTVQDAAALCRIYEDPQIKLFLPPLPTDPDKVKSLLQEYIQKIYGFYGFGGWAVTDRHTGALIGRAGFALWDDPEDSSQSAIELGYLLGAPYRGRGIAREVCSALLAYAGKHLDFPVIYARAAPENTASCRLLERLGFQYKGIFKENDNVYKLFTFL